MTVERIVVRPLMEDLIRATIATLCRVGCQFWDCPGPDVPFVDMRTCYVCSQIQALRAALEGVV